LSTTRYLVDLYIWTMRKNNYPCLTTGIKMSVCGEINVTHRVQICIAVFISCVLDYEKKQLSLSYNWHYDVSVW